jgi:hypothetical protein
MPEKKQPKVTMADVLAVTPEQLATMTPPQIDWLNAALHAEYDRIDAERDRVWERLYSAVGEQKVEQGRRRVWPLNREEVETKARAIVADPPAEVPERLKRYDFMLTVEKYTESVAAVLAKLDGLGEETLKLNQQVRPKFTGEWDRRGGWSRFYHVMNVDGHIHKTMSPNECHQLKWTTRFRWLPDLSGLTEKDAVKAEGTILCSTCFPSAPVEWTVGKSKDDGRCPGSGQQARLDPGMARRVTRYATCHVCNKRGVNVTPGGSLRKHAPENPPAAEAAPEPATRTPQSKKPSAPAAKPAPPAEPVSHEVTVYRRAEGTEYGIVRSSMAPGGDIAGMLAHAVATVVQHEREMPATTAHGPEDLIAVVEIDGEAHAADGTGQTYALRLAFDATDKG